MTALKSLVPAALLFSVLTPGASVAQSPVVAQWKAYVLESCGKEINRSCKGVAAGDGRLLACLYSRERSCPPDAKPQFQRHSIGSTDLMPPFTRLSEFASQMPISFATGWWPVTAI